MEVLYDNPEEMLRELARLRQENEEAARQIKQLIKALEQEKLIEAKYRGIFENAAEGILQTQPDGHIISCNPAAAIILGYGSPEELIEGVPNIARLYVSSQRRKEFYELLQRNGEVKNFELEFYHKDSSRRWVLVNAKPTFSEQGKLIYVDGIAQDITERKHAEEEHLFHIFFLESLEQADLAIRRADSVEDMMTNVLDAALSIFKSDRAWLLYPCDPGASSWRVPMERTRPEFPGALSMGIDIPMTPAVQDIFRESMNSNGPLAFDPQSGRSVPLEIRNHFLVQSQIITAIYPKTGKPWVLGMHQCAYERVWDKKDVQLFQEIGRRIADGLSSLLFLRDLRKSRDELEIRVKERTAELTTANAQLHQRNIEASALYQVSSVISRSMDMDTLLTDVLDTISRLEVFNIEKCSIFLVEGDRVKPVAQTGHSDDFFKLHKNLKVGDCLCGLAAKTGEILISGNSDRDSRHTLTEPGSTPHGHLIIPLKTKERVEGVLDIHTPPEAKVDEHKIQLLLSIGNQLGIAIENSRLYKKTKELSLRDSLTGLWNHEEILRLLGMELTRAGREDSALCVIMADIDFFKKINDTYGHVAGDAVLRFTADRLSSKIRSCDIIGRYGGEEFLIILPRCDEQYLSEIAERLRKSIGGKGMKTTEGILSVTLSLGCAISGADRKWDVSSLVKAADSALYQAKNNGRNRFEIVSPALQELDQALKNT